MRKHTQLQHPRLPLNIKLNINFSDLACCLLPRLSFSAQPQAIRSIHLIIRPPFSVHPPNPMSTFEVIVCVVPMMMTVIAVLGGDALDVVVVRHHPESPPCPSSSRQHSRHQ